MALRKTFRIALSQVSLYPTPYTQHPTPFNLHPAQCSLHPTPYAIHPTPYTPHPTPYTLTLHQIVFLSQVPEPFSQVPSLSSSEAPIDGLIKEIRKGRVAHFAISFHQR